MKRILSLIVLLLLLCGCGQPQTEAEPLEQTAAWLRETVAEPQVNTVGGEWTVLGMARSGLEVEESWYEGYYETLSGVLEENDGVLSARKYTEYSRVVLALTALGKDPAQTAGYDLLRPLEDFDMVRRQGLNGCVFALIAMDSGGYAMAEGTRERYLEELLSRELPNGGWALTGEEAEPDLTAMTLQALAAYTDDAQVQAAVDRGVEALSAMQDDRGGFTYGGTASSESTAQAIVALTRLGISLEDSRFVKNGHTLLDNLLSFQLENGSFVHTQDGSGENLMATEQAFYALVAAERAENGRTPLYDMSDVEAAK